MENSPKHPITGISEDTLMKILSPDEAFKRSNWIEWLANEKSKRVHDRWVLFFVVLLVTMLIGTLLYFSSTNLFSKETATGLIGTIIGGSLSFFNKYIGKSDSK